MTSTANCMPPRLLSSVPLPGSVELAQPAEASAPMQSNMSNLVILRVNFSSLSSLVKQPFIAGGMLFVIGAEIIPETHRRGYGNAATFTLLGGFVVRMFLHASLA